MSWFKIFNSEQKTQKPKKGGKLVFQKEETVENADLHKAVLNKAMNTKE